ncbi:hypothetical protein [Rhodopirellula sp. MGV]|uniref:hypothetical protein n=1 Tax=Rhodopirellula sp. MGV TaxID=2023130 RepID=UPI000B95CD95|nr:hypothetical protein [Rhodopirellula sp. MGV]PNY34786.1 hypothetical protein C2E31_21280 [Rhodopirellula baltica]
MFRFKPLSIRRRRLIAISVVMVAIALMYQWVRFERDSLGKPAFVSGFATLAGIGLLVLLGVRRRIPFWKLGRVSTWTQVHVYTGVFTTAVFVMHVPTLVGGGMFECFLSIIFLMVSASGFYGLYVSRTLPKRLTAVGSEHRFDRVTWTRRELAKLAESTFQQIHEPSAKKVLEAFYHRHLVPFFGERPSLAYVLIPSGNRRRRLLGDLGNLHRYLEQDGRSVAGKFAALVRQRDDLDYQFALQLRLRVWIVFHAMLSSVLLVAALLHLAIVLHFAW